MDRTPRTCERLYSVCAYILHVYIAGTGHTRMQHAHACAAKQSELVRRCIATTALFALSGVHPAGGLGPPTSASGRLASLCPFLATLRTNSYSNTLWLCSWFAKERVIASPVSPGNVREIPLANRGIAYRAVRSIV